MKFTNELYNALKAIALVWLPAVGTLYFVLSGIWGLPDAEQVVGTISAVDTFLGVVLHISTKSYTPPNDGHLVIDKSNPGKNTYTLEINTPVAEIEKKGQMVLQAVHAGNQVAP